MSDDPLGFNAPRRKSRFRSQYEQDVYRPRAPRPTPTSEEPAPDAVESEPDAAEIPVDTLPPDFAAAPTDLQPAAVETSGDEQDDLLPNFRLTKVYEAPPPRNNPLKDWRWLLLSGLLLAAGLGGGYLLGVANAPIPPDKIIVVKEPPKPVVGGLAPEVQAEVDHAFEATKHGRYDDARAAFDGLRQRHPEWWSMGIESARASLYLHDAQTAQRVLDTVTADGGLPDVNFIMALLHLTNKELDLAEASFGLAVAHDPARPDFFYFWGECLRRDGKPREAVNKFRAALLRNQYENAEGLYQLKLWLSQIQSDQEEPSGTNKEIDAALATPRPPYEALFAAAARQMKIKQYPQAAELIARAQAVTEPSVFRVILQDASFSEEAATHPEIAAFYR